MRLRQVTLRRFQQFIDETIDIHPDVTVIVGRNDTGKTSFLQRFFDQHVYEGVIHGAARPRVPGFAGEPISFSLRWDVSREDYRIFPLAEALRRDDARMLEIEFRQRDDPGEQWFYRVNGEPIMAHEGTAEGGWPIRRASMELRRLLPRPYYISIGENQFMHVPFEARLYDLPPNAIEVLRIEDQLPTEALLLRIAGIRADTRPVGGPGIEAPWPPTAMPRSAMTEEEIEQRLGAISQRITEQLRRWWEDPPGLTFSIHVGGHTEVKQYMRRINSYGIVWEVTDPSGSALYSTGLRWFLVFLIKLSFIEDQRKPFLLLFDEPAAPLHPSAQRMVARLLNSLTSQHQIICSTHSPFLIDWNFPQRVRLFQREYESQRTRVSNKPFRRDGRRELIWDPLRESIGVSLGDVSVVGGTSILVEGVSDQILLANASVALESRGRSHFDLANTSIVPYNEEPALSYIVAKARARTGRLAVLADVDDQGRKVARYCGRQGIPCISVDTIRIRVGADAGMEDIIGIESYVSFVNSFYADFPWYTPLDAAQVIKEVGTNSLGKYLADFFQAQFGQSFSKTGVAILIADEIETLPTAVFDRLAALIESLIRVAA